MSDATAHSGKGQQHQPFRKSSKKGTPMNAGGPPPPTGWHYLAAVEPIYLFIVAMIMLLVLWTWLFVIARRGGSNDAQQQGHKPSKFSPAITILIITLLSLFAFGVRVENGTFVLTLNIPEVCAIFVLFFLSELTVHLTSRIEGVATNTRAVADSIASVRKDLISGDLVDIAKSLAKTLPVADLAGQLSPYKLHHVIQDCVVLQNTRAWVSTVRTAMTQRDGDPIHAACWEVLIRRYMSEEDADLKNDINLDGQVFPNPQIATNDRLYLDMLRELASAAATEPFLKPGRCVQFLAITHLLPSWYYNWKHSDGGEYAFPAMEGFRKAVVDIVKQSRAGATFRYRRLCLFTDDEFISTGNAIPKRALLLEQYDRYLLTPVKPLTSDDPAQPTEARLIAAMQSAYPACQSLKALSNRKAHLIFTKSDLVELSSALPAQTTDNVTTYTFQHDQNRYTLWSESLIEHFVNSMHTARSDAEVGIVHINAFAGLPNVDDHDLLMVGYEENGATEWEFAISTNMTPGHETMLIHLVHDKELLLRIANFYNSLQRAPLIDRTAVVNLK